MVVNTSTLILLDWLDKSGFDEALNYYGRRRTVIQLEILCTEGWCDGQPGKRSRRRDLFVRNLLVIIIIVIVT